MKFARVVGVEAPEIDELARCVNFGLEHRFRLVQHCRGVDAVAPVAREQVGAALENRRTRLEPERNPVPLRRDRRRAGALDFGLASQVHPRQHVAVVVRDDLLDGVSRQDRFAVDDARHLDHRRQLSLQLRLQRRALVAAGGVVEYRLVSRMAAHGGPSEGL